MIGLLLQLAFTASVTGQWTTDPFYRDHEALGVRAQTRLAGPVSLQGGLTLTADNGLFPSQSGGGVRHWATGLGLDLSPQLTLTGIYGRFIEQRSGDRPHPGLVDITYYQLVGAGLDWHHPRWGVRLETVLTAIRTVHSPIHRLLLRVRAPGFDLFGQMLDPGPQQAAGRLWVFEATERPLHDRKPPWRWLGVSGGIRAVPSYQQDRTLGLGYLAFGFFFTGGTP